MSLMHWADGTLYSSNWNRSSLVITVKQKRMFRWGKQTLKNEYARVDISNCIILPQNGSFQETVTWYLPKDGAACGCACLRRSSSDEWNEVCVCCVCVCVWGGGGGGGGAGGASWGGSSVERRDSPDPSSRLASFTLRGEKAGRFREVAGVSIVNTDGPCSAVNTFNGPFTGTDLCILSQEHSL